MKKSYAFLIVVFIVSAVLAVFWSRQQYAQIKTEAFEAKKSEVVKLVRDHFSETASYQVFDDKDAKKVDAAFKTFFGAINNPIIFRVKVISLKPEIIWSNLPNLIGTSIAGNSEFELAVSTKQPVQGFKSLKSELITERQFPTYTETYVPVLDENGVVRGVIEVYENDALVNAVINDAVMKRIVPVLVAMLAVYLILFVGIFMRARRTA